MCGILRKRSRKRRERRVKMRGQLVEGVDHVRAFLGRARCGPSARDARQLRNRTGGEKKAGCSANHVAPIKSWGVTYKGT